MCLVLSDLPLLQSPPLQTRPSPVSEQRVPASASSFNVFASVSPVQVLFVEFAFVAVASVFAAGVGVCVHTHAHTLSEI